MFLYIIQKLSTLALIAIIIGSGFYLHAAVTNPCRIPITIKIDEIDPNFNLSMEDATKSLEEAVSAWETAALGKDLFEISNNESAKLTISFVYDERQKTTDELDVIEDEINNRQMTYASLKQLFESKKSEYDNLKISYDRQVAQIESSNKPLTKAEHSELEQKRLRLNSLVDEINSLVKKLNGAVRLVNDKVVVYNTIQKGIPEEFDQGLYKNNGFNPTITIYQINDNEQLFSTFIHELGHSLNLDHNSDIDSIMYYLNTDTEQKILPSDILDLKSACRLPQ